MPSFSLALLNSIFVLLKTPCIEEVWDPEEDKRDLIERFDEHGLPR